MGVQEFPDAEIPFAIIYGCVKALTLELLYFFLIAFCLRVMAFMALFSPEYRNFDEIKSDIHEKINEWEKKQVEGKRRRYG